MRCQGAKLRARKLFSHAPTTPVLAAIRAKIIRTWHACLGVSRLLRTGVFWWKCPGGLVWPQKKVAPVPPHLRSLASWCNAWTALGPHKIMLSLVQTRRVAPGFAAWKLGKTLAEPPGKLTTQGDRSPLHECSRRPFRTSGPGTQQSSWFLLSLRQSDKEMRPFPSDFSSFLSLARQPFFLGGSSVFLWITASSEISNRRY